MTPQPQYELQQISYKIKRFDEKYKCNCDMFIIYMVRNMGYEKYNYIPNNINNEDFQEITKLSLNYMKKYGLILAEFNKKLKETYNYCKINGYLHEVNQLKLEEF